MARTLLSLQIIPRTPGGEDVIPYVDRAIALIAESGVDYRVGPLETTMTGEFDELLAVVRRVNDEMASMGCPSVISQVRILHEPAGDSENALRTKYDD